MFARFNENPAMTLQDIKETKRYGRTDGRTDARTDGQRENSIPPTNKVCGGYNKFTLTKLRENKPFMVHIINTKYASSLTHRLLEIRFRKDYAKTISILINRSYL